MELDSFLKDLFEYHHYYNQRLLAELIKHGDVISERTVPLYAHMINAHQIWNSRIVGGESFGVNDMHTLQECMDLDRQNFGNSLQILEGFDLNTSIHYQNSRGAKYDNTIYEMLFQVINHTTHHRGQIISDLRQSGIAPMITDYIFYKR